MTTVELNRLRARVEEGWDYHSDIGIPITPEGCEAGLTVSEARSLFELAERGLAAEALLRAVSRQSDEHGYQRCPEVCEFVRREVDPFLATGTTA